MSMFTSSNPTQGDDAWSLAAKALQAQNAANAGSSAPAGAVIAFAGSAAPSGWLLCDGSEVSKTTYAALYTAIGDAYANSPGVGNFNLPNLLGRVPAGVDGGSIPSLGSTRGQSNVTLNHSYLPPLQVNSASSFAVDTSATAVVSVDYSNTDPSLAVDCY